MGAWRGTLGSTLLVFPILTLTLVRYVRGSVHVFGLPMWGWRELSVYWNNVLEGMMVPSVQYRHFSTDGTVVGSSIALGTVVCPHRTADNKSTCQ